MVTRTRVRRLVDSNIAEYNGLISPFEMKREDGLRITAGARRTVEDGRGAVRRILSGRDRRVLMIVGPCSSRDLEEHKDFAARLKTLSRELDDIFFFVQRVYFEKPRTSVGWKGLINEPYLDGMQHTDEGLRLARRILMHNANIGLPSATEFLEPFVPQYIGDLVSWAAIGARTVESPTHRQMASGLSMPVGFKNNTYGDVKTAVNAVIAARQPQWFFGIDEKGKAAMVNTFGNSNAHIVLRGGDSGPNYGRKSIAKALGLLKHAGLPMRLVVDCSHGNSNKDYRRQPEILDNLVRQIAGGNRGIVGLMLESNIYEGRQDFSGNPKSLRYGVSITDGCISWNTTERAIRDAYKVLARE